MGFVGRGPGFGRPAKPASERFEALVCRCEDGCWRFGNKPLHNDPEFRSDKTRQYKLFFAGMESDPHNIPAHVYSYMQHKGPVPPGMVVCHSCDVKNCVNPDHLWAGTQKQNLEDMRAKGRGKWLSGSENPMFGRSGPKNPMFGVKRVFTPEHIEKMTAPKRGRKLSEEHRNKISQGLLRRRNSHANG